MAGHRQADRTQRFPGLRRLTPRRVRVDVARATGPGPVDRVAVLPEHHDLVEAAAGDPGHRDVQVLPSCISTPVISRASPAAPSPPTPPSTPGWNADACVTCG